MHKLGIDPKAEKGGDKLAGMSIVITGNLKSMTRDQAVQTVRRQGGRVTGSVSGNTDYLVRGEDPGRGKVQSAKEHGTPIINEKEFHQLLGRSQ